MFDILVVGAGQSGCGLAARAETQSNKKSIEHCRTYA